MHKSKKVYKNKSIKVEKQKVESRIVVEQKNRKVGKQKKSKEKK